MAQPHVLAIVLAGGEGRRLAPLTDDRAKPGVPFGGVYRLIDFVLSNLVNGGYLRIVVLTQYKSHSLDRHLSQTWRLSPLLGNYVTPVPAQMRRGPRWFSGSADAIYQNLNLIHDERPDLCLVFGADHIYRMDPRQMVQQHLATAAAVTVAGIRVPREEAFRYGVIQLAGRTAGDPTEGDTRIAAFHEKPRETPGLPVAPDEVLASMGNYVFTTEALVDYVTRDAALEDSAHDMGRDIVTAITADGDAHVYDFGTNDVPGATDRDRAYWRDVGTLDSYYDAQMDLVSVFPVFNLYNRSWPIHTWTGSLPPAKFVFDEDERRGVALHSMVSGGVIVSGGTIRRSVISPGVFVHSYATVESSVILHDVQIGRHAVVRNAILDKHVVVPDGARIGVDLDRDRERYTVSDGGIVVIGKGVHVPEPEDAALW